MNDAFTDPQYKTGDGAALRIWRDTAPNKFLTESLGRPLFDEVIFCDVIAPGSRDSTPTFELERVFCPEMNHPEPKRGPKYTEYKTFIDDFKKNEEIDSSLAGTPLNQWPEMNRSLIAQLKAAGVFTVDALAGLPDTKLNIVGPDGRTWREKAKAYIENAKNGAYATELAAKLETVNTDLASSQQREQALAARVQELETLAGGGTVAAKTAKKKPEPDTTEVNVADGKPLPII